ncbi:uncharacterized protein EI97DRAFT_435263 [Westerdykella ornata]|uniref:Uncharacterized protein n=1 Tax=Westerdykella ornata TaxID=318751 RepID=A0A6A6JCT2_WESOR|nr:uncharacterized protein EI97DRAFT_435263 [Westerdykella ornata]KAF2274430.1 hypothetical protein EI97DRAFT_435263 [Westerdykella ornata]
MDWAQDNVGLSEADLRKVFKYEPKQTTVVKIVKSRGYKARIWSLESSKDWECWIEHEIQGMNNCDSGLILILAKRAGERSCLPSAGTSIEDWLARSDAALDQQSPGPFKLRRAHTYAGLDGKQPMSAEGASQSRPGGNRNLRTLPFSYETFKFIAHSFHIHGSIARVVSRADVPYFSSEKAVMSEPAYIYSCRSSNAWDQDLALSATYFPGSGLTFSILYGCPFQTEENIIRRLRRVTYEAAHPLLLPGIFAELEVLRHTRLVETTINKIETKILELNDAAANFRSSQEEVDRRNEDKRESWLDLTYLRNSLVSWNTQLGKLATHATELSDDVYRCTKQDKADVPNNIFNIHSMTAHTGSSNVWESKYSLYGDHNWCPSHSEAPTATNSAVDEKHPMNEKFLSASIPEKSRAYTALMREAGDKIKRRIMAIRDDYDEKIRDCTMRVDGMAMATQWSHGETNVEIALATNRDSKVMRSIALVTMVFLPGTFFATVFSMTFFDWFGEGGKTRVSSYLWIYILITLIFTLVTVGCWYFFVFYRQRYQASKDGGSGA